MNRYEVTKKVGLLGIIGNIFLLVIKLAVSLVSNSKSLLADTINSAADIFSSVMTFVGSKIAKTPSDDDHNFGHGKAEYIFSMLISIFMILVACKIFLESCLSIFNSKESTFSYYLVLVCVVTIATKLGLYLYCKKLYQKHNNILIKASMKDHKSDTLLTTGVLVSAILSNYGFYFFDGIIGALISLYILISGVGIFLESYKVLMDVSLDKEEKEEIINFILSQEKIINVTEFDTVATGYKYIAILTIDVNGEMNTFDSHNIADELEKNVPKNFRKIYKVIVHVNPVKV